MQESSDESTAFSQDCMQPTVGKTTKQWVKDKMKGEQEADHERLQQDT